MVHKLKVLTLNVRGLNGEEKRRDLLTYLVKEGCDIVLLQETKCQSREVARDWMRIAPFESDWSCSGETKGGAAILVRKGCPIKEICFRNKNDGRRLSVDFIWEEKKWKIENVYAPDTAAERRAFLKRWIEELDGDEEEEEQEDGVDYRLVGGDWNCIGDTAVDKIGGDPATGRIGAKEISEIMGKLNLEDLWRRRNPEKVLTTWEGNSPAGPVMVRLDRWFSSRTCRGWIKEITHFSVPFSDHKGVEMLIEKPEEVERGKGSWCFNQSLLKNRDFHQKIKGFLEENMLLVEMGCPIEKWEWMKGEIKRMAMKKSKDMKRTEIKEKERIRKKMEELEADANRLDFHEEWKNCQTRLKEIEMKEMEGMRIRAKMKKIEQGTAPSKFFSRMVESRRQATRISALKDQQGISQTTQVEIMKVATAFYEELYGPVEEDEENEEAREEIFDKIRLRVSEEERRDMDEEIKVEEVRGAIARLGREKSPGPDGLPAEFYQAFKVELAPLLVKVFERIEDEEELPASFRKGIISVLYKKGDEEDIKNYRPITLLNVDYKILTKILAERLAKVLPSIIEQDQKLVKGRYIHENTRMMLDVVFYLKEFKKKGGIVLLDQEKAFDRVSWSYLKGIVKTFGFGGGFRRWIDILYSDAESSLKINNFVGEGFAIRRGVRQGDPLSALLYVMAIEGFACLIRKRRNFEGIDLPEERRKLKIMLYADDSALFLGKMEDLEEAKSCIRIFEKGSNSRINWSKCEGLLFNLKKPPDGTWGGKWLREDEIVKYLGVPISGCLDIGAQWEEGLEKFVKAIKGWSGRYLTLVGRKVVLNHYLIPKLSYLLQVIPLEKEVLVELERLIFTFLWGGKRDRIKRTTMVLPVAEGGLGVVDLVVTQRVFQAGWILRMIKGEEKGERWAKLARYFIRNRAAVHGMGLSSLLCSLPPNKNLCPPFWSAAVESWEKLGAGYDDEAPVEIISRSPLWFNPGVRDPTTGEVWKDAEGRWCRKGIILMRDLFLDDHWMSAEEVREEHGAKVKETDLWRLYSSFPERVREAEALEEEEGGNQEICWEWVRVNGKEVKKMKNGDLRNVIRKEVRGSYFPECQIKWGGEGVVLDWRRVWKRVWRCKVLPQWNCLYFLILHRAVMTGERAEKMKMEMPPRECGVCKVKEDLRHLFLDCEIAQAVWEEAGKPSWQEVLEGRRGGLNWAKEQRAALWTIWTERCKVVYGGEEFKKERVKQVFENYKK